MSRMQKTVFVNKCTVSCMNAMHCTCLLDVGNCEPSVLNVHDCAHMNSQKLAQDTPRSARHFFNSKRSRFLDYTWLVFTVRPTDFKYMSTAF